MVQMIYLLRNRFLIPIPKENLLQHTVSKFPTWMADWSCSEGNLLLKIVSERLEGDFNGRAVIVFMNEQVRQALLS